MVRCMGEIGLVLRQAREERGESQAALSYRMHVPASTISRHEQGQQDPTAASIHGYVSATGIPLVVTPDGWDLYEPPSQVLPYYGKAPCGAPLYITDAEPEELDLAGLTGGVFHPDQHYVLLADGDSMEPYIFEGDFMLVDHRRVPQVRDIVVANINDDGVTVKQLGPHPASGRLVLCPANPRHDPLELHELDEVDVQGVVIGCIRKFVSLVGPDPIAKVQQTRRRKR